jgi:hypothetical protein
MTSINCDDNTNLFQPTGFRVIIDRQYYGTFQFFVARVNHPGAQNPAQEAPFRGKTTVPFPGNYMTYGELGMDVLLDEDFQSYKEIYEWMLRHVNEDKIAERGMPPQTKGQAPSYADIHITALTSNNTKNVEFKYIDCVPVSVGDIPFDAQNQSVEYVTFPVSFQFSYFEIK